jgi:hypothetical protein
MKVKVVAAVAVASLVVAAGTAVARTASGSTITIQGSVGATVQNYQVYGTVRSPSRACVPDRTVRIFSLTPDGPKLIDTDRTSDKGYFFGGGNFGDQVNGVRVKVLEKTVGGRLCKSDTDTMQIL